MKFTILINASPDIQTKGDLKKHETRFNVYLSVPLAKPLTSKTIQIIARSIPKLKKKESFFFMLTTIRGN